MMNLLIVIAAMVVALRLMGPLLRIALHLLLKLLSCTFFIAVAIVVLVAVLSHGRFI
ncbi:MAG TPA: hypothetical protein VG268_22680 [Streptosporangiaceae bacterium]|jgi:hypothetical protein|nr:hypothetical protein [Streptosporangiaceae bacterium]